MGIVYILTNPAMPDLIKIGRTDTTIEQRVGDLSRASGVPVPFVVFFAAEVEDSLGWERALHQAFDDRRLNPKREFFRLSPDKPHAILRMAHLRNVTPKEDIADTEEEREALDKERKRSTNIVFSILSIRPGAMLQSVFDETIECEVVSDREVKFRDEICSLSSAALIVAHETGRLWKTIRGSQYWKYEGQTLLELKESGAAAQSDGDGA